MQEKSDYRSEPLHAQKRARRSFPQVSQEISDNTLLLTRSSRDEEEEKADALNRGALGDSFL